MTKKQYQQLKLGYRYNFIHKGRRYTNASYGGRFYNKVIGAWVYKFCLGIGHVYTPNAAEVTKIVCLSQEIIL